MSISRGEPSPYPSRQGRGVHTLYLQFDGVSNGVYKNTRGRSLLETKLKVIDNCREVGIKIVFVPTVVKGINDGEVGAIVKLAVENVDVVSGISYQPVVFTGRISKEERERMRFTLSDLARCIEEQTGFIKARDWAPLACSAPLSRILGIIRDKEVTTYSSYLYGILFHRLVFIPIDCFVPRNDNE